MEVRPERELPCCSQLLTGLYIAESRFVCACMCVCVYVVCVRVLSIDQRPEDVVTNQSCRQGLAFSSRIKRSWRVSSEDFFLPEMRKMKKMDEQRFGEKLIPRR